MWLPTRVRLIPACCLLLMLAGCGFQPRGESARPAANLSPVIITGQAEHTPFHRVLSEALDDAGVSLGNRDSAVTRIHVLRQKSKRLVLSVDERGKTVEFELEESLEYRLTHPVGSTPTPVRKLVSRRILYNPGTQLLGRSREQAMLRQDMYQELSRQLINHLATLD